ncbi:MAG TPA: polyprenol monophosphomannose synthase [Thermodesulfobacteriota bacterium]|nr:polyprenol monophosphomannose synthase [Thermodesulfobacteriota bacterium]
MKAVAMIPTYNEAQNIEPLLRQILALGPEMGAVVVDDDSPDGTAAIVERVRDDDPRVDLILRKGVRGRGSAGVAGFKHAVSHGADLVIEMDADFSHPPSVIPSFLEQMDGCDLLIGSRLVEGGGEQDRGLLRRGITLAANAYIRLVLGIPVRDCTSGFRVFRRQVLEAIELDQLISNGPPIVEEVLYKVHRRGFRIREVPYIFEDRRAGQSTFNKKIMLNALLMMPKFRWWYRKYPS